MTTRLCALLLASLLPFAACGGGASDAPVRATVVAVDVAKGEVTLDHDEIPGLMKAMTMTFEADPALLAGIEAGREVRFRVRETSPGRYVVTSLEAQP